MTLTKKEIEMVLNWYFSAKNESQTDHEDDELAERLQDLA